MHPHRAKAKAQHAAKIKGFATGGRVGTGTDLYEPKVKLMKGEEGEGKAFGGVTGMKAKGKPHMGGKKPGVHVNVINMPHGGAPGLGGAGGPPPGVGPMPPIAPVGPPPATGIPPVRPPMGAPMGMAPGMPPIRKHGGRVQAFAKGGAVGEVDKVSKANPLRKPTGSADPVSKAEPIAKPKKGYATGGKVSVATPTAKAKPLGMDAGACSGEGRIEKEEKYGGNAGKPAKSSATS